MDFNTLRNTVILILGCALIVMAIRLAISKDSGNYAKSTAQGYGAVVALLIGGFGAALTAGSLVGWTKVATAFGIG